MRVLLAAHSRLLLQARLDNVHSALARPQMEENEVLVPGEALGTGGLLASPSPARPGAHAASLSARKETGSGEGVFWPDDFSPEVGPKAAASSMRDAARFPRSDPI